uniref:LIM domain 7a n=1 Tax=Anabas testudineus TaxID=64144 RepID=A0A3Q1HR86_ANATE
MHSSPLCPFLSFCPCCSSHIQPHTLPQLPKIQSPLLETPPLVFAPVDPTSGPKLVKCERWPLLGRQDPREPPDPIDYDSIIPDLDNDDMFARRTLAFQSNVDLAMAKSQLSTRCRRYTSEPQLNIITQRHDRDSTEEEQFPDIEEDDVVYRKEKTQQAQRPLSGAPDNYAPMPIPEPWTLPPDLKAKLLCPPCPLTNEAEAKKQNQVEETHPKTDDMLVRKFGVLPSSCSEGDLQRWQAIREASQLRYKKRLLLERLAALKSKSTSDIQVDPSIIRQVRYEEMQKFREQIKQSEDKWQDDLSKWKSRRRSVNSDIVKKKEERETIEHITYGSNRRSKTFKEMQEERYEKMHGTTDNALSNTEEPRRPLSGTQTEVEPPSSGSLYKQQPQLSSMEPKPSGLSRVSASLPRSYQRSDSARLTSVIAPRPFGSQSTRIASLPRASTVSTRYLNTTQSVTSTQSVASTQSISPVPPPVKSEAQVSSVPAKETTPCFVLQENYCEMRINLNQKPNSSRDFGFQADWDSTGARVSSIQPGSPADMCQLQAGDEVLTVNGHKVAEMSYTDWKSCMEEALQEGSLVMDIRRHGKNSESSEYCVCVCQTPCHVFLQDVASNGVNGSFREEPVTMRNKVCLLCLQIPVPSIIPSSSRWSWDPEEERRRQEKWQKEQERLLQVRSSSDGDPTPSLWEEEERKRKRKEEQERQRQAEETRKREEEERKLQLLQEERKRREKQEEEERKRKEKQEEEERKRREEEELRWQRKKEEEREAERRRQEAVEQERRERQRALEQQWSVQTLLLLCFCLTSITHNIVFCLSALSIMLKITQSHVKIKTTQPLSQAELERQQILNEMKKKTSLVTDSSWIRQRSSTTTTSKESDIPPMRRGESLDNLDASSNSWRSSWTPRSNSVQNYIRPHSALSGSGSFYSSGAGTPSSSWSRQTPSPSLSSPSPTTSPEPTSEAGAAQQRSRSVSGKKICTFCDTPLGKGAAMIIESLGLCYHLGCFKCIDCKSDLGGSEAGAEVRIRNKQLYCNSCYMRFKSDASIYDCRGKKKHLAC